MRTTSEVRLLDKTRNTLLRDLSLFGCFLAGLILVSGLLGSYDYADEKNQQRHYCEMVKLNKKDASIGWPDYNGTFAKFCVVERNPR